MQGLQAELTALLGPGAVLTEGPDLEKYEKGWRYGAGKARLVVRPSSTAELSKVMALCLAVGVRVVPQGANTGLVGASVPDATGEMVVLSLERLNHRLEIDALDRTVRVEGGVLLSQLNAALAEHGLVFPVDLGADPQIGGMVATNTGGTRLLKYGDVRHNLLGVEVVLADGTVLDSMTSLRKDNTGLDLKQLFTGTTGIFGVVTGAVLNVVPLPRQRVTALVGCVNGAGVLGLLQSLERECLEVLTAFEAISSPALKAVFIHQPRLRNPYGNGEVPAYTVLVELSSTLEESRMNLGPLLEETLAAHLEGDGGEQIAEVFMSKPEEAWEIRHHVSESLRNERRVLGLDISVPRSKLPTFTEAIAAWVAEEHPYLRVCDFGHWGDGGTHLNLVWRPEEAPLPPEELIPVVQKKVYDLAVLEFGGSFSAEHGVGPHNQRFYDAYTPAAVRALCATLKRHFDPEGTLGTTRLA
jgi:FAD/FMN-containing dehydrogenase